MCRKSMKDLQDQIIGRIDLSKHLSERRIMELIDEQVMAESKRQYLDMALREKLRKDVFHAVRQLGILQELIEDQEITEIMVNGIYGIFVERHGKLEKLGIQFDSAEKLKHVIRQITSECNRVVNESSPIVDARLKDGARVNVVLDPVALNGPILTIRRFPQNPVTVEQLLSFGSLTEECRDWLKEQVRAGCNILVSGGTGSGKTTFLNALSQYIPKTERIITIEDNAELKIQDVPNLVRLEARNANVEGAGAVTIRDLIKSALRMRPDRIIVGEVRSAEAIDMLQALNTGHDGSLSTGHANSPADMLGRLETMVLMGMDLPLCAIQRQIASGIDVIVHLGRLRDKSRKLLEVTEILGYQMGEICLQTLYKYVETGEKDGKIQGEWKKEQELVHREKLLAAGYH